MPNMLQKETRRTTKNTTNKYGNNNTMANTTSKDSNQRRNDNVHNNNSTNNGNVPRMEIKINHARKEIIVISSKKNRDGETKMDKSPLSLKMSGISKEDVPKIERHVNSETQRIVDAILGNKSEALKIETRDEKEAKRLQNRLRNYQNRTGTQVYKKLRIEANTLYLVLKD